MLKAGFHTLLWLVLCSGALAAPEDAVVKVAGCSGVCVHEAGLVMTAKHCGHPEKVMVEFPNREPVPAVRIYVSPEEEGPVVFDCEGEGYPFAPVANAIGPECSEVWSVGYAAGQLRKGSGKLTGGTSINGKFRVNFASFRVAPGWSGGPLFDTKGEVIGLCHGVDNFGISLWITFTATRTAYDKALEAIGQSNGPPVPGEEVGDDGTTQKLALVIFGRASCPPCKAFQQDYATDAQFSDLLLKHFQLYWMDADKDSDWAQKYGVVETPVFFAYVSDNKMRRIEGYQGKQWLLQQLGLVDGVAECPPPVDEEGEPESPLPESDDLDAITQQIVVLQQQVQLLIERDPERGEPGPPGDQGPQGAPGRPGRDGKDGQPGQDGRGIADVKVEADKLLWLREGETEWRLAGTVSCDVDLTHIEARLAALENSIQVETPEPELVSHFVLVADESADYWQRMRSLYQSAEANFRMRFLPEPEYPIAGELPALVAYAEGKPLRVWRGQRSVSDALNRIARGEASHLLEE